jgi:transposase-like protein
MDPDYIPVAQFAATRGRSVPELIAFASEGSLTISAVANEFGIKAKWVRLMAADLLASFNKDYVPVSQVLVDEEQVELPAQVNLLHGKLYVSREARVAFLQEHYTAASKDSKPAYLEEDHPNYSESLAAAVNAWTSLCAEPKKMARTGISEKQQIENWLRRTYSDFSKSQLEAVARIVNPNKRGGAPRASD